MGLKGDVRYLELTERRKLGVMRGKAPGRFPLHGAFIKEEHENGQIHHCVSESSQLDGLGWFANKQQRCSVAFPLHLGLGDILPLNMEAPFGDQG